MDELQKRKSWRRVGRFRSYYRRVVAREAVVGGRVSGFLSREVVEHVCSVGFIRQSLDLHRSEIYVTVLLEFVDLGLSTEPQWLRDAVESKSSRQACVTSNGGVHVRIFFACVAADVE